MRRSHIRGRSLVVSALGHFAAFSALTQVQLSPATSRRPIYDEFVRPKEHKILYYRPPKVQAQAVPEQQSSTHKEARAWMISPQTAIANAPKPQSQKQIIWQAAAIQELPVDVPVPSVIARVETAALQLPPKPAAKQFTPPPPSAQQPKLATRSLVSNDVALNVEVGGTPLQTVPNPALGNLPTMPREDLPQAPTPAQGNAKADVAIASLNPSPTVESAPLANRAGEFARAPVPGDPSPGARPTGALTTPNIAVRDPAPKPPEPPKPTVIYSERVRSGSLSTLSAPMRPSNRSVPRALESRFTGRSVYTIVIPIEKMASYDGDWVLWFAENAPAPGQTPLIRAPSPLRQMQTEGPRATSVVRVQLAAVIGKEGKLRNVSILSASPALSATAQEWVLEDLQAWEFTAAQRSGQPIDIDAVFDIPYHLPQ